KPGCASLFEKPAAELGLLCRSGGKFSGHKIFIWSAHSQLSGTLQDILEQIKAAFLKDQIALPCILVIITRHDRCDSLQVRLRELRLDDFGDFLRGVSLDIVHALLQSIGESLDDLRILFDKALLCAECGV